MKESTRRRKRLEKKRKELAKRRHRQRWFNVGIALLVGPLVFMLMSFSWINVYHIPDWTILVMGIISGTIQVCGALVLLENKE